MWDMRALRFLHHFATDQSPSYIDIRTHSQQEISRLMLMTTGHQATTPSTHQSHTSLPSSLTWKDYGGYPHATEPSSQHQPDGVPWGWPASQEDTCSEVFSPMTRRPLASRQLLSFQQEHTPRWQWHKRGGFHYKTLVEKIRQEEPSKAEVI